MDLASSAIIRPSSPPAKARARRPADQLLKKRVAVQHDPLAAQQIHSLAQDIDGPAGDERGLTGMRLSWIRKRRSQALASASVSGAGR